MIRTLLAVLVGLTIGFGAKHALATRNSAGTYSLPSGNPVVSGTTITTTWANTTLNDISTELTNSLDRQGRGAMQAPLQCTSGSVSSPALTFSSEPSSGLYRAGANDIRMSVGGTARQAWTSSGSSITGALSVSAGATVTQSTTNGAGLTVTANGNGAGVSATGGASGGLGGSFTGGGGNSGGVVGNATGGFAGVVGNGGSSGGTGVQGVGGAGNGYGVAGFGNGTGYGGYFQGGATGPGMQVLGGSTSGDGLSVSTTSGNGITVTTGGNGYGISATASGTGAGATFTGGASNGNGVSATAGGTGTGGSFTGGSGGGIGLVATGGGSALGAKIVGGVQIGSSGTAISASYRGTTTWNPGTITAGSIASNTIAISGASASADCIAGVLDPAPVSGIAIQCIARANACDVALKNQTSGSITLGSATFYCRVFNP